MLIQGKILSYGDDLTDAYRIRKKVFVEELNLTEEAEFDGLDDMAMHVIVYEEAGSKKAVATGRIYFDGSTCEIGHVAVLKEYRNKMYGDFTVRMLLNKAFTASIHDVNIVVQTEKVGFFEKIGFHINSEVFKNQKFDCNKMRININDVMTACHNK